MHEQMFQSCVQSEARPPVFKSPRELCNHLSTHYSRDERLTRPFPARFPNFRVSLQINFVTPFQTSLDAESLLIGRKGITVWLLDLVTPHVVDFETGDWFGNYSGHLFVDWIKGGQGLTYLRT
ncbi:hypothetical protein TNCV_3009851 [Trichonephila clavipes]|nr:hypothetical protein TNCV_3009851 [Trichonephila clavipes]